MNTKFRTTDSQTAMPGYGACPVTSFAVAKATHVVVRWHGQDIPNHAGVTGGHRQPKDLDRGGPG